MVTLLGLGSSAVGAALEEIRPLMLAAMLLFIGIAFYYAYIRRPSRRSKITAWLGLAISGAISLLNYLLSD
jgi:hypothetical protein